MLQHVSVFHFVCCQIIVYCRYIPILFIHPSIGGYLGYFNFLAVMNNAAMNIHVHVFVWT